MENFEIFNRIKVNVVYVDGGESEKWKLSECIYFQANIDENVYVYNKNKCYKVRGDCVADVEDKVGSIKIMPPLPNYEINDAREDNYLKRVCDKNSNFKLLDQKLHYFKGNKIELCDIFDMSNRRFIHVKKGNSSSMLSHLFSQAFVSADMFSDQAQRMKILPEIWGDNWAENKEFKTTDYSVVIAIIKKQTIGNVKCDGLPFFSKVNLLSSVEQLERRGYSVYLMFIDVD